jgi:hypothetical protein
MRNLLIVLLVVSGYLATGLEVTVSDYLKYRGEVYMVNSEPLAIFFDEFPKLSPKSDLVLFGENKRYEADFVIDKEQLFLTAIWITKFDSIKGDFTRLNVIQDVFCCDTLNLNWLSITIVANEGSGTRLFNFNSGKLISTNYIKYYGDYLNVKDNFVLELKSKDEAKYDFLKKEYESRGIQFSDAVELNFINIFAACATVDKDQLSSVLKDPY